MPYSILILPQLLPAVALILFRVAGLMIAAPLFGASSIPERFRVLLALAVTFVLLPLVGPTVPADLTLADAVGGVVGEVLIGLLIGVGMNIVLFGAQLAGLAIGQQGGLGLAQVFDPTGDVESTTLGEIAFLTATAVFLIVGGHRHLMAAMLDTFTVIPPLGFRVGEPMLGLLIDLAESSMILALRISGPVMIAVSMAELAMAMVSRTVPQLNILSIGFPLRSLVTFGVAGFALYFAGDVILDAIT